MWSEYTAFWANPREIARITPDGTVTMSELFGIDTVRAFYIMWLEWEG